MSSVSLAWRSRIRSIHPSTCWVAGGGFARAKCLFEGWGQDHGMIDARSCYEFIGFYSSKSSCIATVIRSNLSNHSTKQQNPTSKKPNFWKQTNTLARFLRDAHVLLGLQPCLVDKSRSWRNGVSHVVDILSETLHNILKPQIAVNVYRTQTSNVGSTGS